MKSSLQDAVAQNKQLTEDLQACYSQREAAQHATAAQLQTAQVQHVLHTYVVSISA